MKLIIFLCLIFSFLNVNSQEYLNLNRELIYFYEHIIYEDKNQHTSILPYFLPENNKAIEKLYSSFYQDKNNNVTNFFFNKNLVFFKKNKNSFAINPIFQSIGSFKPKIKENAPYLNLGLSENFKTSKVPNHFALGFSIKAKIKNQFFFNGNLAYNLKNFTDNELLNDTNKIVNHWGKAIKIQNNQYQFLQKTFLFSYFPNEFFDLQIGYDKHFIGDGYRSLLLSDNSNAFPFYKLNMKVWKFHYINLVGFLKDYSFINFRKELINKYINLHFLSYNITKKLNVNIFEAVISASKDSLSHRGFEINYLNPVIFYRPLENAVGSPDNVLMGAGFKFEIIKDYYLYGQGILDEFSLSDITSRNGWSNNKYGFQLGLKLFNFLNIENLQIQTEYNYVRPFTYSHRTSLSNYGNYYHSLAHPLGSNFREILLFIRYRKSRFFMLNKTNFSVHGQDKNGKNYGGNIYNSYGTAFKEYNNFTTQGEKITVFENEIKFSYLINPIWHLEFQIKYVFMKQSFNFDKKTEHYFSMGLKTLLYNY